MTAYRVAVTFFSREQIWYIPIYIYSHPKIDGKVVIPTNSMVIYFSIYLGMTIPHFLNCSLFRSCITVLHLSYLVDLDDLVDEEKFQRICMLQKMEG